MQGLSYEELADALGVSVPAVKSLLLRARTGLVDIALARETPCPDIRADLVSSRRPQRADQRPRPPALRGVLRLRRLPRRAAAHAQGFAALTPEGRSRSSASLLGIGGGGSAARRRRRRGGQRTGGAATATTSGGALGGAGLLGSATAAKVAAVVATAGGCRRRSPRRAAV